MVPIKEYFKEYTAFDNFAKGNFVLDRPTMPNHYNENLFFRNKNNLFTAINEEIYDKDPDILNLILNSPHQGETLFNLSEESLDSNFENLDESKFFTFDNEMAFGTPEHLKNLLKKYPQNVQDKLFPVLVKNLRTAEWDIPTCPKILHLNIKKNGPPLSKRIYPIKKELIHEFKQLIDRMLFFEIIERTYSRGHGSPAFVLPKTNAKPGFSKVRLLVDFRAAQNHISDSGSCALPSGAELIDNFLGEGRYCASLDLRQSYYSLKACSCLHRT